jgi:cyclophilin family peptidyl-prolyl cis-trans isomerase
MRALALLLAAFALGLAGCGGGDGDESGGAPATTETAGPATTAPTAAGCEAVEAPDPREDGGATEPTEQLEPGTSYGLTFETNCGSFTVALDRETAPNTVRSLVALAEDGFYDGTVFHRIVPGFVIQGGDPTGTGTGGPGYQTVDPPPATTAYTKGVVAMAKTATEPAGAAGSQFFVVTAEDAALPADYAVVGEVTDGLDVVERIGELGDASQQPTQTVLIERVTVSESR